MVSTYERWREGRPVRDSLPGINNAYQTEISDWLSESPDNVLAETKAKVDALGWQLDPRRCDEQYLDYLASALGWHGERWDRSWPTASKRELLAESFSIVWPNYGTATTLGFVLNALNVRHIIQEGDSFVIGRESVGDVIGLVAWDYSIILPSASFNTDVSRLAERINFLFGPCWCKSRILFDDSPFKPIEYLAIDDGETLLSIGNDNVLEI